VIRQFDYQDYRGRLSWVSGWWGRGSNGVV